jgi:hypothetical protein
MDWFQRYGIPGAAFWGFLIMWVGAFHNGTINHFFCETEKAKLIAAVAAGSFLPIGYLLSVMGQLIYHYWPKIGIDTKARLEKPERECLYNSEREWKQEVASMRETICYLKAGKQKGEKARLELDDIKFVFEWMSKRMGMLVINVALILAVGAAMLLSLLLTIFLLWQFDWPWFLFALILSLILGIFCRLSWKVLREQLVRVERILLSYYDDPILVKKDSEVSAK